MSWWRRDGRRHRERSSLGEVAASVGEVVADGAGAVADVVGAVGDGAGAALEGMGGCAEGCGGCATVIVLGVIPLGFVAVWQGLSLLA